MKELSMFLAYVSGYIYVSGFEIELSMVVDLRVRSSGLNGGIPPVVNAVSGVG